MQHVQQKNQCSFYFKKDETIKNTCFQVSMLLPMTRTLLLYSTHNCWSRRVLWGLPDGVQEAIVGWPLKQRIDFPNLGCFKKLIDIYHIRFKIVQNAYFLQHFLIETRCMMWDVAFLSTFLLNYSTNFFK